MWRRCSKSSCGEWIGPAAEWYKINERVHLKRNGKQPAALWGVLGGAVLLLAGQLAGNETTDFDSSAGPVEAEPLIVTAGRLPQDPAHTPLSVVYFDRADLAASAALTADDFLRDVPGFSLFRRTGSLAAHPTTQGVSLRGIAPSGTSRSLVLYDGMPMNDPFGGWVYWGRMDLENIEQIEVVRGGGSTVWGNAALGGVVHLTPRRPEPATLRTTASYGIRQTERVSFFASDVYGPLGLSLEGRHFHTDGYKRVRKDQRGDVDIEAASRHWFLSGAAEYTFHPDARLTLRASWFDENRNNGTPLTHNAYEAGRLTAKLDVRAPDGSDWELSAYGERGSGESTFSSVAADRNSETLVLDQHDIPSRTVGSGVSNTRETGYGHRLTLGADSRWVDGATNERSPFFDRRAGGEQYLAGMFAESIYEPDNRWRFSAGGRLDYWRQFDGFSEGFATDPPGGRTSFDNRDGTVFSPRVGVMYQASPDLSWRGAIYRGFRIPTINELYRPFQVGTDRTFANSNLSPERLTGAEIGIDRNLGESVNLKVTAFWNEVSDQVANVTVDTANPLGGSDRQRQNLDLSRIVGLETEITWQMDAYWKTFARHAYTDARVERATNQPALEGLRLAQVPEHVLTAGIGFSHPELLDIRLSLRYNGPQFEDDLNERQLGGFTVFHLYAARRLRPEAEVFAAVENLFNRRYPDGITGGGLVTEGPPIFASAGIRLAF